MGRKGRPGGAPVEGYRSVVEGQLAVALHPFPHQPEAVVLLVETAIHVLAHLPDGGVPLVETWLDLLGCPCCASLDRIIQAVLQRAGELRRSLGSAGRFDAISKRAGETFDGFVRSP